MVKRSKIRFAIIGFVIFSITGSVSGTVLYKINKTYDPNEIKQIREFLLQPSTENSRTNGQIMHYPVNCPILWLGVVSVKNENGYRNTKHIAFFNKNKSVVLKGTFRIKNFIYLETFDIGRNYIDSLIITDCPQLKSVKCLDNNIAYVVIYECPNLEELRLYNNPIERLNITGCPNLKELDLGPSSLKELIVLETHPWQEWKIDSTTTITVVEKSVK